MVNKYNSSDSTTSSQSSLQPNGKYGKTAKRAKGKAKKPRKSYDTKKPKANLKNKISTVLKKRSSIWQSDQLEKPLKQKTTKSRKPKVEKQVVEPLEEKVSYDEQIEPPNQLQSGPNRAVPRKVEPEEVESTDNTNDRELNWVEWLTTNKDCKPPKPLQDFRTKVMAEFSMPKKGFSNQQKSIIMPDSRYPRRDVLVESTLPNGLQVLATPNINNTNYLESRQPMDLEVRRCPAPDVSTRKHEADEDDNEDPFYRPRTLINEGQNGLSPRPIQRDQDTFAQMQFVKQKPTRSREPEPVSPIAESTRSIIEHRPQHSRHSFNETDSDILHSHNEPPTKFKLDQKCKTKAKKAKPKQKKQKKSMPKKKKAPILKQKPGIKLGKRKRSKRLWPRSDPWRR
ncbi:uncharacterized protein LOC110179165 [Drosophila serrata]|uniref:uncharacterized protein LOC110179165 n=1 Tax=Drosophila serrata TaxID=7274 RepID=UPI000A1D1F98|nr:uncharacterized protein LOC110179165 [Drosophila serrata]XP_020802220.1 uncharacterized protein LOC110179165 [Drosophila serrata]XP_020802221.1 uncharacterized protein LOC110179165 [Drosophila serrata]